MQQPFDLLCALVISSLWCLATLHNLKFSLAQVRPGHITWAVQQAVAIV